MFLNFEMWEAFGYLRLHGIWEIYVPTLGLSTPHNIHLRL